MAYFFNPATSGPAAQAGLRYGDIIVGLNEKGVANMDDLRQRVASMARGGDALVEVWRVAADDGDFLRVLRRLADEGNAESMYRVGRMYARRVRTTRAMKPKPCNGIERARVQVIRCRGGPCRGAPGRAWSSWIARRGCAC
jgi:hypothetical protein